MIELKNVRFTHENHSDKPLLDIKQWTVSAGESVFVCGPSGSGKSTLLNLLSGLLTCSEGEVSVLGQRLDQMSSRQRDRFRANNIGYVFQRFNLIPYLNAVENIDLARSFQSSSEDNKKAGAARTLLTALNISESEWSKPTAQMSVGQQQRVAIARALVNRPSLMIADEPTSSLDEENRDSFLDLLMPLLKAESMSLVFVSHDMSLAHHFSRVEKLSDISGTH